MLALLGLLAIFTQGSAVAPFIYTQRGPRGSPGGLAQALGALSFVASRT
ncbi:MAG: DUF5989 family protein [Planctomycetota bacterium]